MVPRPVGHPQSGAAPITVTLLGGFAAAVDGAPVPEGAWRLKKARELVKLLALAPGHRLHREQAMDVLWRDRGPAAAANNLHQAVHVARRALDAGRDRGARRGALARRRTSTSTGSSSPRPTRAAPRTPAAYRAALALYGGELLPENRYDDWAEERRDELAALAAELADELAALGAGDGAARRCRRTRARSSAASASSPSCGRCSRRTRLLTLAGTGGAGKTRLALELARGAEAAYADGAALVELAPLSDPRLVPDAVAAALDVRALPGQDIGRGAGRLPRVAHAAARARQLRAPARRRAPRSPTRCSARRRG